MFEYEDGPRTSYDFGDGFGSAVFVRVCPSCGRFVKADDPMNVSINYFTDDYRLPETNATCAKCGPVAMPFEGFF